MVKEMYEKASLSFQNPVVFERTFKANINQAFCVVAKMLVNNRLNIDGSIDMEQASYLRKYQIWSYIYYLYYYNNSSVEEFANMKNKDNGKASAVLFYDAVRKVVENPFIEEGKYLPFDVNTLIYYVNSIIYRYGENMRNPVVDYLRKIVNNKEAMDKLIKFKVETGKNVEVVTNATNANVKVKIGYVNSK